MICVGCKEPVEDVRFKSGEDVYCESCAELVEARMHAGAGVPNLPYKVIRATLKATGFSAAGDPCIAPEKKCPGKLVRDPVMLRHRCDVCGYGF